MSTSKCCFLIYIQISQEAGKVVWYSISLRIFQFVVIPTVKGFSIINDAEADVFLEFPCFLCDPEHESESCCSVASNSLWPMDYTVHGVLQARILEWVAYPFSSGSSQPRNWTGISWIAGGFFTSWATRKAPRKCWPLISCSSAFSKPSLYIWKFLVHVLLRPRWRIFSIVFLALMWARIP